VREIDPAEEKGSPVAANLLAQGDGCAYSDRVSRLQYRRIKKERTGESRSGAQRTQRLKGTSKVFKLNPLSLYADKGKGMKSTLSGRLWRRVRVTSEAKCGQRNRAKKGYVAKRWRGRGKGEKAELRGGGVLIIVPSLRSVKELLADEGFKIKLVSKTEKNF